MGLRTFAREVAHVASYRMCGSNDMFETNFDTLWKTPRMKREAKRQAVAEYRKKALKLRRH